MIHRKHRYRRRGATAVEFALVVPIVFLIVFSIIEISKLMLFEGHVNTAVLAGVREATLIDSTPNEVESLIRDQLSRAGISEATIEFSPSHFDQDVERLEITVDAPLGANGVGLGQLIPSDSKVTRSIVFDREF